MRIDGRYQEQGDRPTVGVPQSFQKEPTLLTPPSQTSGPQNCEGVHVYCSESSGLWQFVTAVTRNESTKE